MLTKLKQMYKDAKQVHHLLYEDTVNLEQDFHRENLAGKVDIIHAMKQISALLEDVRKAIDKLRKKLELLTAIDMQMNEVDSFKTDYCTSKVKVKQYAKYPAKRRNDPDKFDTLMKSLGIPDDIIGSESVRLNWEGFSNWFTLRQQQGLPLPEGITPDDVYTEYELVTRKLKDVDDE